MLKIETKRDPVWVDLPSGARIQFKPLGTAGMAAARAAVAPAALLVGAPGEREGQLVFAPEDSAALGVGVTIAAARWGALVWEGVGDAEGQPLELTADNVQALLEQDQASFDAVDAGYVRPYLQRASEKNVSSPARPGGSRASGKTRRKAAAPGAGGTTARPAGKTAPAPAKPVRSNRTRRKPS